MFERLAQWFGYKWDYERVPANLIQDYHVTFSTQHGRRVLDHLLDTIYCSVYEGKDPSECLVHNARRSVIHEILQNIDYAAQPLKYGVKVESNG